VRFKGFRAEKLDSEALDELKELSRIARGDILKMTTFAGSGHPGGSMSSIDIYIVLYSCARIDPKNPYDPDRDRIVVSHGHTSPGVYAALGRAGFFNVDEAIAGFRKAGTMFEGHIERDVPGIEWSTGNLGQGLSAGCGFALAAKILRKDFLTFVAMSDAEQAKGQVAEARRFAKKYGLTNLTVIIDYNRRQISGSLDKVMPQNIKGCYEADGWRVIEIDGHDHQEIYCALREAVMDASTPVAILAHTVMGKGVSFMENREEYHGKALTPDEYRRAMGELGLEDDLERYRDLKPSSGHKGRPEVRISVDTGRPFTYTEDIDNRGAFGKALADIAKINLGVEGRTPVAVLDCDLASSVKTDAFWKAFPDNFFEGGVQEHNTATIAGALSTQGVLTFFSDFGVFGVDETYNQHRLNDINGANLKLVCTHNGLDVGQDGKTHQCIDYVGLMSGLYGFKIIIPADGNQTDRVIRYIAKEPGNFFVGVGRSKLPIIRDLDGKPFYGDGYEFVYGRADLVRDGKDAAIISCGTMVHRAIQAWEILSKEGYSVKVINLSCLSDPDLDAIADAASTGAIITYEDHNVRNGLGSIVAGIIAEQGLKVAFRRLGVTSYGGSGKPDDLFKMQGLDVESLVRAVVEGIRSKK